MGDGRWDRCQRGLHILTITVLAAGAIVATATWRPPTARPLAVRSVALGDFTFPAASATSAPPVAPSVTTAVPIAPTTAPPVPTPASIVSTPSVPVTTSPEPAADAAAPTLSARVMPRVLYVYAQPAAPSASLALYNTTEFGNPRILPVVALGGDWLKVMLPTRPNGAVGWVRARDVALQPLQDRVVVDLATRRLAWYHDGRAVLQTTTAVGAPASPTPTGEFFVTDVLSDNPSGAYGAFVIALDAHSEAFTVFDGGDARIAIHGTNDPGSIGEAASNGCLRLPADSLATLAASLPAGTPVIVR